MIWIGVLLVAIAAVPFAIEMGRNAVSQAAPEAGKTVQLSQGRTHMRWTGPVRGPVIVAVHGLTTPSEVWQAMSDGLNRLGYRVLVYDLYGRGLSDAPAGPQNAAFFRRQLADVLEHEGLSEDLILMGYSMGGSIITSFAAENPQMIKRLVLIATAGVEVAEEPPLAKWMRMPLIGDWLHALIEPYRYRKALAAKADMTSEVDGIAAVKLAQTERRGFFPAVLSSRRGMLAQKQEAEHRKLGHDGVPLVAVWGDADPVIPITSLGVLVKWNRLARQEVIKGADHDMPHTHATELVAVLRDILREG